MVYLSSSLALSALEVLVNLPPNQRIRGQLPVYVAVAIDIDPAAIADHGLPARQKVEESQAYGDAWLKSASSLGLLVPSRVIPLEMNVLLNPHHPEMARVKASLVEPFVFDDRLGH